MLNVLPHSLWNHSSWLIDDVVIVVYVLYDLLSVAELISAMTSSMNVFFIMNMFHISSM